MDVFTTSHENLIHITSMSVWRTPKLRGSPHLLQHEIYKMTHNHRNLKLKICTFNSDLKFRQSNQIFSHTDFFRSKGQRFDIVCLQETGLLADPSEIPSDLLNKYTLYTNYERHNNRRRTPNFSTAILLSPRIQKYFLESIDHPSGTDFVLGSRGDIELYAHYLERW